MTNAPAHPNEHQTNQRHDFPFRRLVLKNDLVTDQALTDAGGDEFHHTAIAKAVADLALSATSPANIALFGPWGSGKSTFYILMKDRIGQQDQHVTVVRYDAWKYGGEALKRNFLQDIARQLHLKHKDFDRDLTLNQEQSRIRLGRWARFNYKSILGALLVGLVVAAIWTGLHTYIDQRWIHPERDFWDTLPDHVNEFGLVLAAVLTTLLLGPKALESAVVKTTRPAIDRDDQFADMFSKLVKRIKKEKGAHRIVFFIDELDRCEPKDVVATLVDLKTFLDEEDCVFVVAADREVLEHALRLVPQGKPIREDDPYYATPGAFIDKIFQHQIALPPLRSHALSSFAHRLVSDRSTGVWRDLQENDSSGRLFNDVVYILVPAHVSSPRRVKVLLNNFATNARIAQSRNIEWTHRARELAFLTVLETEFPTVSAALIHFPDLLAYIRKDKDRNDAALPADRKALIDRLDPSTPGAVPDTSVAGRIVRDPEDPEGDVAEKLAQQALARQLDDYLSKLAVVTDLHDPRPDLFYLRVVGYDEGITDPALGELIDLAADRQPATLLAAFNDESPEIKATAADLLIKDLAQQRGTGQANVLESACRLIEELPHPLVARIASVAPEVLNHLANASSWRLESIPGATFLAAETDATGQIADLMDLLDPATAPDAVLLRRSIPALAWASDEAAKLIHAKTGEFLPTDSGPLRAILDGLPEPQALRAYSDIKSAVTDQYTNASQADRLALFEAITNAVLSTTTHADLLWETLRHAISMNIPGILSHIHERRDDLLPRLNEEHRTLAVLYEIELGDPATWADWSTYLSSPEQSTTHTVSEYARDAAVVIAKQLPITYEDLTHLFAAVSNLLADDERPDVLNAIVEQVPLIAWNDADDPNGHRWANLTDMTRQVARSPLDEAKVTDAIAASLQASVTATLPTMTTAQPEALIADWHRALPKLSKTQCKSLDAALATLTAPTPKAAVTLLRLRIAVRLRSKDGPLGTQDLLAVAGEPAASVMAGEWLSLMPTVENVMKIHPTIPIGNGPLGTYAKAITNDRRTTLWTALEAANVSRQYLKAVGQHGVQGSAIAHVAEDILHSPQQQARNVAVDRLLQAAFAEVPSATERDNGETVGHKQATDLALALLDTGVNDNVILAAKLIIHSNGYYPGTKTRLRTAFSKFGNGKQARNFTKAQAKALREMGLLIPHKRGPIGWLVDLVTS